MCAQLRLVGALRVGDHLESQCGTAYVGHGASARDLEQDGLELGGEVARTLRAQSGYGATDARRNLADRRLRDIA